MQSAKSEDDQLLLLVQIYYFTAVCFAIPTHL